MNFEQKCDIFHRKLTQLADIPQQEWAFFKKSMFEIEFAKGQHIFFADQKPENGYLVISGLARFYYVDIDGNEVNKSFKKPGDFLASLLSLRYGMPAPFSAQALNDMQLIGFKQSLYLSLFDRHPCWQEVGRNIAEKLANKKEQREVSLLLEKPEQRYKRFLAEFEGLVGQIPDYQIARYLGITAVGFSRIKKRVNLG